MNHLSQLFDDCFAHLGEEALYQGKQQEKLVRVLIKQPDIAYQLGEGQFIGETAVIEVRISDLPSPKVGDYITVNERHYKIYQPPLKDSSSTLWRIQAMVMKT